jgi:hypothetical protein
MLSDYIKNKVNNVYEKPFLSVSDIKKAEEELQIIFHDDLMWLLLNASFIDENNTVISGLDANDQVENIIFLNNSILKNDKSKIPANWIAISYENKFNEILFIDNISGEIFSTDYHINDQKLLYSNLDKFLSEIFT